MNLRKGFRRLALTLSILAFPVMALVSIVVAPTTGWGVWSAEDYIVFTVSWGMLTSLGAWVVCRFALFVIEGFGSSGACIRKISTDEARRIRHKIKKVALGFAVAGLLVGVYIAIVSIQDIGQRYDELERAKVAIAEGRVPFKVLYFNKDLELKERESTQEEASAEMRELEEEVARGLWISVGNISVSVHAVLIGVGAPIAGFVLTWVVVWLGGLAIHRWFVLGFRDYQNEVKHESSPNEQTDKNQQ